jgi:hypothetical protein
VGLTAVGLGNSVFGNDIDGMGCVDPRLLPIATAVLPKAASSKIASRRVTPLLELFIGLIISNQIYLPKRIHIRRINNDLIFAGAFSSIKCLIGSM